MVDKFSFRKGSRGRALFMIVNWIFMGLVMIAMLLPLLKVLSDSFDNASGYDFRLLPAQFTFDAYRRIVVEPNLSTAFGISGITTIAGTFLAMFLTTLGAFVLTKKDMPGRKIMMYMILFTMMFSGGLIPTYMQIKNMHLLNSLWAVILPLSVQTYYLILMKNFFAELPDSIQESAEIDGCSPIGIFFKIILPMSKPAIAAISLFYFVSYWNDWFHFVMYVQNRDLNNFQVKLREMVLIDSAGTTSDVTVGMNTLKNAAIIVAILPVMMVYPFVQKYFVTGLNLGAVKG